MNALERLSRGADGWRRIALILLAVAAVSWPASCGIAWAQEDEEEYEEEYDDDDGDSTVTTTTPGESESPPYVLPYALVILCVGLGVFLVCRSANRHAPTKKWAPTGLLQARGDEEAGAKEGPAPRTKELCKDAQTGLILAITGLIPAVGIFTGAFGLWKSVKAKKMIAQNRLLRGEGMALAGIIIAPIAIVISLAVTVVILIKAL